MASTDESIPQLENGKIITTKADNKQFQVLKKLGEGGFGAVYKMKDLDTHDLYAMKTENANDKVQVLKMEVQVLKAAEQALAGGGRHFCRIVARGRVERINYVIMTLLGPSLADLRRKYGQDERRFTPSTVLRVAIQTLEALEDMHRIGFIHRDVKPANFAIGRPEDVDGVKKLYILDFGLCRLYRKDDGSIRLPRDSANFRGTVRYAPLNCHRKKDLSRKDDLETWFYQTTELTVGSLPWNRVEGKAEVGAVKEAVRQEPQRKVFLNPSHCPPEYDHMLDYIDKVQYWEEPDYEFVYSLLRRALARLRPPVLMNDTYDWEEKDEYARAAHHRCDVMAGEPM